MVEIDRRTVLLGGAAAVVLAASTLVVPGRASATTPIGPETPVEPVAFDSPTWGALPLLDRQVFTMMSQVFAAFRAHGHAIWGDYRLDRTQVVFPHWPGGEGVPGYAYVVNARRPASLGDAQPVDLPGALRLGAVHRITRGAGMDAALSPNGTVGTADIAGVPTLIIGFGTSDVIRGLLDFGTWFAARVLVHEAFHAHGATWAEYPLPDGQGQPFPADYPRDAENAALALLEDAVLGLPLDQPAPAAAEKLRTYLAIRAVREDRLPEIAWREGPYQSREGTARFVEDRYVRLSGHRLADRSADLSTGPELLGWIGRRRGYPVGAACGELLEAVVGPRWRTWMPLGKTPGDVAAAVLGLPTGGRRDRLVAEAKETHDYPRLLDLVRRADLPHA
ncbi:hypothetical protein ACFFQW_44180 [Umezawaea endophytica]|uniref:Uncharacterized protein n=1 Tax=Umezawaea endophytica TaxID=1654476 RepID=A0A9X3AED0_9PSEU|nr:hypothetical protein [Umezawaea endophytica]MCS7477137.1 hypothetical protein [Umezawaea endophytica]